MYEVIQGFLESMHKKLTRANNCMDNALTTLCRVRIGHVPATMGSMLLQHRKKGKSKEM